MEKIRERLRAKEIELSKHRKLLNRAVGNRILPRINYHHYEIVILILEIQEIERELNKAYFDHPLIKGIGKQFQEAFTKLEDEYILTGTITPPASSHTSEQS